MLTLALTEAQVDRILDALELMMTIDMDGADEHEVNETKAVMDAISAQLPTT